VSGFKLDEVVDVTIKGVRIARPRSATSVTITDEHGTVYQMPPQAAVERVAPAEWPPKPGDLWRDRSGVLWFHQNYYVSAGDMGGYDEARMVRATGSESYDDLPHFIQARGPMTLEYREGAAS
jgi:hypothetical protein